MRKSYDTQDIKERFALLISRLFEAKLLTDYVNKCILESSFFDCFENNDLDKFMNASFETIAKEVFRFEYVFDYGQGFVPQYYWAGLSIMEIVLNYDIPLKRILTIFPLSDVVGCFDPYHEMHPIQICEHYLKYKEKAVPLLKILRESKNLSLSEVSYLTKINVNTLRMLDNDNASLFSTSFENITKLATLFNVHPNIFKKKSDFVPFSMDALKINEFKAIFIEELLGFYGYDKSINYFVNYEILSDKQYRNLLKEYKIVVDFNNEFGIVKKQNNRLTFKRLDNEQILFVYKNSLDKYRLTVTGLVF